jgi:hypothetical protein
MLNGKEACMVKTRSHSCDDKKQTVKAPQPPTINPTVGRAIPTIGSGLGEVFKRMRGTRPIECF